MAINEKILADEGAAQENYDTLSAFALNIMKSLNCASMMFISLIMCAAAYGTIRQGSAAELLDKFGSIPLAPWKIPVLTFLSLALLLILMGVKKKHRTAIIPYIAVESALCVWLCYLTSFAYTGVILLCVAELVRYMKRTKLTALFTAILCAVYLAADFDLLSNFFSLNSYNAYLSYYNISSQQVLLVVRNISTGVNIIFFIVYMILILRRQGLEYRKVRILNRELGRVNEQLAEANKQLAENAATIAEMTQLEERNRLAREIHDTLGHALTGIVTGIDACMELILIAPDAVKNQLQSIADVARQGMTDVRRSVKALRPDALEKMELGEAIENMIEQIVISTHVTIDYECGIDLSRFDSNEEEIIYRIVQESITNALRHGKATVIKVDIYYDDGALVICISDNGIGCKDIKNGFGLTHMKERLDMLGGRLECDGTDGFTITARMPVRLK